MYSYIQVYTSICTNLTIHWFVLNYRSNNKIQDQTCESLYNFHFVNDLYTCFKILLELQINIYWYNRMGSDWLTSQIRKVIHVSEFTRDTLLTCGQRNLQQQLAIGTEQVMHSLPKLVSNSCFPGLKTAECRMDNSKSAKAF